MPWRSGRLQPSGVDDLADLSRPRALDAHADDLLSAQAGACAEELASAISARENHQSVSVIMTDDARRRCRTHFLPLLPWALGAERVSLGMMKNRRPIRC